MANKTTKTQKPWYKKPGHIIGAILISPILLMLGIATWFISFPVLGFFMYKSEQFPIAGKTGAGILGVLFLIIAYGSYDQGKTETKVKELILAGDFVQAQEIIDNESGFFLDEYQEEINKLNEQGIKNIIDQIATGANPDYEQVIQASTFSQFNNIDQQIKDTLLKRLDEIKQRKISLTKEAEEAKLIEEQKAETKRLEAEQQKLIEQEEAAATIISEIQLTIDDINNGAVDLFDIPKRVNKFSQDNQFTKNEFNKLVSAAKTYQRNNYPSSRKEFAKESRSKLWREDYEVYVSGPGDSTITFVNWRFSANANIEDFHNVYKFLLEKERFKKVIYKSSEYGGGTSYTLNTEKDDVILGLET